MVNGDFLKKSVETMTEKILCMQERKKLGLAGGMKTWQ